MPASIEYPEPFSHAVFIRINSGKPALHFHPDGFCLAGGVSVAYLKWIAHTLILAARSYWRISRQELFPCIIKRIRMAECMRISRSFSDQPTSMSLLSTQTFQSSLSHGASPTTHPVNVFLMCVVV